MQSAEIKIGRAGEYLVMFDLLSMGFDCFLTAQGCSYDIILQFQGRFLKVQVKTTKEARLPSKRHKIPMYSFKVTHNGGQYSSEDVDIFAFVCMDSKEVAYVHGADIKTTFRLFSNDHIADEPRYARDYPFERVVSQFMLQSEN